MTAVTVAERFYLTSGFWRVEQFLAVGYGDAGGLQSGHTLLEKPFTELKLAGTERRRLKAPPPP